MLRVLPNDSDLVPRRVGQWKRDFRGSGLSVPIGVDKAARPLLPSSVYSCLCPVVALSRRYRGFKIPSGAPSSTTWSPALLRLPDYCEQGFSLTEISGGIPIAAFRTSHEDLGFEWRTLALEPRGSGKYQTMRGSGYSWLLRRKRPSSIRGRLLQFTREKPFS